MSHAVELADGAVVPCDVGLVAIGVAPAVELMEADRHGIPTDSCGRTAIPGVYACGDVAAQWRPSLGRRARVEHWTSAVGQGAAVAHAIAGADRPYDDVPYFWSDQFGLRLQHVGHAESWDAVEVDGEPDCFAARYLDRERRLPLRAPRQPPARGRRAPGASSPARPDPRRTATSRVRALMQRRGYLPPQAHPPARCEDARSGARPAGSQCPCRRSPGAPPNAHAPGRLASLEHLLLCVVLTACRSRPATTPPAPCRRGVPPQARRRRLPASGYVAPSAALSVRAEPRSARRASTR